MSRYPAPTITATIRADVARAILLSARDRIDSATSAGREARSIVIRGMNAIGDWQAGFQAIVPAVLELQRLAVRPVGFDAGATPSLAEASGACTAAALVLALSDASPAADAVAYVRDNA